MTSTAKPASRHTVESLRPLLRDLAVEFAGCYDERARKGQLSRYLHAGEPGCLIAVVLTRLGFSVGVLGELDREASQRRTPNAGVRINASRHPIHGRFDRKALWLLDYLQQQQDACRSWDEAIRSAFCAPDWVHPAAITRTKPWLS